MVNSSGVGFGPGIPGLQFGIGLGAGCGIGYGFGFGVGRGVAHDEKRRYSIWQAFSWSCKSSNLVSI